MYRCPECKNEIPFKVMTNVGIEKPITCSHCNNKFVIPRRLNVILGILFILLFMSSIFVDVSSWIKIIFWVVATIALLILYYYLIGKSLIKINK